MSQTNPPTSTTPSPHSLAQPSHLPTPQDTLVPYLIFEIEDYLSEDYLGKSMERTQADYTPSQLNRIRITLRAILSFTSSYASYKLQATWQQWATNPYNLHPSWHLFILFMLLAWIIGSSVCGFYEVGADGGKLRIAKFCRGALGSVPPIIQLILFLYPPLFVQF